MTPEEERAAEDQVLGALLRDFLGDSHNWVKSEAGFVQLDGMTGGTAEQVAIIHKIRGGDR